MDLKAGIGYRIPPFVRLKVKSDSEGDGQRDNRDGDTG